MSGQLCEAYYFIGIMRLIKGDKAAARDFLQNALAATLRGYDGYQLARAKLAHIDVVETKPTQTGY